MTINYAPDRAARYDLNGDPIETLSEAVQCGRAYFILRPDKKDMSVRIGKLLVCGRYHNHKLNIDVLAPHSRPSTVLVRQKAGRRVENYYA